MTNKIWDIYAIKVENFVEAKFKYLLQLEKFGWMPCLTTQYPVHENLLRVFFSKATLKDIDEHNEDLCRIVVINTFLMGVLIQVTQWAMVETFCNARQRPWWWAYRFSSKHADT